MHLASRRNPLHRLIHPNCILNPIPPNPSPEETQLTRLILRDNLSPTEAQSRIASQMPIDKKRDLADIVIDNSGSKESTLKQVDDMVRRILPGKFRTVVVWSLLCVPAALLYGVVKGWEWCSGVGSRLRARNVNVGEGRIHGE